MKYTWGDEAMLKKLDQNGQVISKIQVSVVGVTPVENEDQSKQFKSPIGSVFYTVELPDGSDAFISEDKLEQIF